jgi:ATP-dependent protease HslVU (ClpYQ) ATPase subunit
MWRWRVTIADGTGVQARNNIHVAMEDLTEEDRKELEHELEEEMVERRHKKLACFQKTRHGIVKKADTAAASRSKVDSSLNLEDLVQLVDVLVASKYGTDLTQFTHVVVEEMRNTLDYFKQDMNSNLPR